MSQLKQTAMLYKMVIVYILLFSVNSLCSATVASFLNVNWSALSTTAKFLVVIVILQNWTGVLLAFFNKSIQRAEQGKPIIPPDGKPNGGTDFLTKTAVEATPGQQSTQSTPAKP